eukprot:CAMPEP_0171301888 /NCGR_PEP_ID=MMETSP0816-20121228/11139_1 /TAXON_ID=420281 /ORGANISM="Proboscia inermis, Strain CCAP1064/1" /LENGTH=167 /DNA_ID=CAMNT_0011779833 /DNA_START=269 /DNA_END=772 /DNA_ORIENTATION=-
MRFGCPVLRREESEFSMRHTGSEQREGNDTGRCGQWGQRAACRGVLLPYIVNAVLLPNVEKVVRIAAGAGANHSVVLGESGTAYKFGANGAEQCGVVPNAGRDDEEEEGCQYWHPQAVVLSNGNDDNDEVVSISAGYAHTVLSTISGKVYVFGQNGNWGWELNEGKS